MRRRLRVLKEHLQTPALQALQQLVIFQPWLDTDFQSPGSIFQGQVVIEASFKLLLIADAPGNQLSLLPSVL